MPVRTGEQLAEVAGRAAEHGIASQIHAIGDAAVRTVLGQQVSVAAATTVSGRLAARCGPAAATPHASLDRLFPTPGGLAAADLVAPLQHWSGPLLGICVGLQLFFEHSEEDGTDALGLMAGRVARLQDAPLLPHIGWNDVNFKPDPLFAGVATDATFYFVHSYYAVPEDDTHVVARTDYAGASFPCIVQEGSVVGTQFHPEYWTGEHPDGRTLIGNFATWANLRVS